MASVTALAISASEGRGFSRGRGLVHFVEDVVNQHGQDRELHGVAGERPWRKAIPMLLQKGGSL